MCLIFIAQQAHPDYPLIIAANRDEFYNRPSQPAHFWPEHSKQRSQLLAGKDLLAGGTWLGITRTGRFAAITNYRHIDNKHYDKSRGNLITDFLNSSDSPDNFTRYLYNNQSQYAGFNCIYGLLSAPHPYLHYFGNHAENTQTLQPGIYGLSNALLDTPWHKVTQGKQAIQTLIEKPFNIEEWLTMLSNKEQADDSKLPDTGIGSDKERQLSPRFIQLKEYGTRCSSVITVSKDNTVRFTERSYITDSRSVSDTQQLTKHFQFRLPPPC